MTSGDLDLWDTFIRKNMCISGYVLDICAQNEGDRTNGLWGVSDWTNRHTHRLPYAISNIDILSLYIAFDE